jgi:hypothetical protein
LSLDVSARSSKPEIIVSVQLSQVEKSVSKLATLRSTPGFDASFKESVTLIKKLYESAPADRVDAQDLAMTAFNFYMDHHNLRFDGDTDREAKQRKVASDVGLIGILGW